MNLRLLVGVAVAALGFGLASCGDIPSCEESSCKSPAGVMEFNGITQPKPQFEPQAFAPVGAEAPDESQGGGAR